jgi:hypothetical protein
VPSVAARFKVLERSDRNTGTKPKDLYSSGLTRYSGLGRQIGGQAGLSHEKVRYRLTQRVGRGEPAEETSWIVWRRFRARRWSGAVALDLAWQGEAVAAVCCAQLQGCAQPR